MVELLPQVGIILTGAGGVIYALAALIKNRSEKGTAFVAASDAAVEVSDRVLKRVEAAYKRVADEIDLLRGEMLALKDEREVLREKVSHLERENGILKARIATLEAR